jgi:hypothetical protein
MISEDSGSTWTVIATPDNAGTHSYYNAVGPIYVEDWGRWYFAWIYHGNLLGGVSFPLPNAAYQVFSIDLATETTWTLHASKDQDTSQTVTQLSNLYFSTVRGGALYRLPDPDYEPPS